MKVAVIGTGYVGLVSGVCLASRGHQVTCVDVNESIVERLNAAEPTIHEAGLPELLREVRNSGHFTASLDLYESLEDVELVIIAVGTPSENGQIDLRFVKQASTEIGKYIACHDRHISVIIKSTVIPGTTDTFVKEEIERSSGKSFGAFGLGMNPEFLREGDAIEDFNYPDRIILGYEDDKTLQRLESLYESWNVDKLRVNTRTAEMIKYANNAILATQISAVNEIANLAAAIGKIDVSEVMEGIHLDKRWNPWANGSRVSPQILTYLIPGCGFGGSCFPKDVQALRSQGESMGLSMDLLNAVLAINDSQPYQVTKILEAELGELAGKKVLLLGLAFKVGTDDVRESASAKIALALVNAGAKVTAHDPIATSNFKSAHPDIQKSIRFVEDWEGEVPSSQIIIIATKWPAYAALTSFDLKDKVVFDARRLIRPTDLQGARYLTIGRRL